MPNDMGIEKTTVATCIFNEVEGVPQRGIEFEFEGFTPRDFILISSGERSFCGYQYVAPDDIPALDELEAQVAEAGF